MNNYPDIDNTIDKLNQIFEWLLHNIDITHIKNYSIENCDISCQTER